MNALGFGKKGVPRFRRVFDSSVSISRIGDGELGGKARGLVFAKDLLDSKLDANQYPSIRIDIPTSVVLTTDVFDSFVTSNNLLDIGLSDASDERIALAFQEADFPVEHVGDLRAIVEQTNAPLAVRSSSLLEDAMFRPFAGVYETKMIPNNEPSPDTRFRRLIEALKFVYSSMFTQAAKSYLRAANATIKDEKMSIIIQDVVGERHDSRYYPHVAGVARSYNFYPTGRAKPRDGVVNLGLGLGKTIVDGGISWMYSPARPTAPPPFASVSEILKNTQLDFWAVNMGEPPEYNPIAETEYLTKSGLREADYDGSLEWVASTYAAASERLVIGTGLDGPRVLNFGRLLQGKQFPLNDVVKALLSACEEALETDVEIEFAMTMPNRGKDRAHFGFLQVRPMVVSDERVEITDEELSAPKALLTSQRAMGNGVVETLCDVVYVRPDRFEAKLTRAIAAELEAINRALAADGVPYLLIGFGRWGSSDPWLGIPLQWAQISNAKVLVEATLPDMNVEPSQGSHFFHNMTSFRVSYFSVPQHDERGVDWGWLDAQACVAETEHVRHVRSQAPVLVKVDGRSGRGGIWYR